MKKTTTSKLKNATDLRIRHGVGLVTLLSYSFVASWELSSVDSAKQQLKPFKLPPPYSIVFPSTSLGPKVASFRSFKLFTFLLHLSIELKAKRRWGEEKTYNFFAMPWISSYYDKKEDFRRCCCWAFVISGFLRIMMVSCEAAAVRSLFFLSRHFMLHRRSLFDVEAWAILAKQPLESRGKMNKVWESLWRGDMIWIELFFRLS